MKTTVVTSFSAAGQKLYGNRFLAAFDRYFPPSVDLVVYLEAGTVVPGREVRYLTNLCNFQKFMAKYADSPVASGRAPGPTWKPKDVEDGYCYRFDAVKFCRKVFAISDAAIHIREGLLVWLDADSFAHAPVPDGFFASLIGSDDVAYLGRDGTHSECGFLAFKIPTAMSLIVQWENFYRRDSFLKQREWHDSFLFDRARELAPQINCRNLTPGGRRHVWLQSPLAPLMDHLKGSRKHMGFSPERRSMA